MASDVEDKSPDELELEIIDSGAQDIKNEEEGMIIMSKVADLQKVQKALEDKNIKVESADIEYIAKDESEVSSEEAEKIEKFIEILEDCEDVSDYYSNVNI